MSFDVDAHTIFVTLAGSQAHGTARAESDLDLRGVCLAPLAWRVSLFQSFEQHEGLPQGALWQHIEARVRAHPTAAAGLAVKAESVVFELAKFVRLCAQANPNALEILFADERDWLFETPLWRRLHAERRLFLTRKAQQTYLGYALAQLKRIRTHRAWLLSPPARKPTRQDFGLPEQGTLTSDDRNRLEQAIAQRLASYGLDDFTLEPATRIALEERLQRAWHDALACPEAELEARLRAVATHALSLPPGLVSALNAEKKYLAAIKQWESYLTWQAERNPARAALEARFGYDTKHATHLVRLMRTGLELLETGELSVRRRDADELRAIRDGSLAYDELMTLATELEQRMQAPREACALPADVDRERIDALVFALISS